MLLNIPTRKDFEIDSAKALEALFAYIYGHVFCDEDRNGFACASCEYFLIDWHRLEVFWQRYGEISQNQEKFKTFCLKCAKEQSNFMFSDAVEHEYVAEKLMPKLKSKNSKSKDENEEETTQFEDDLDEIEAINCDNPLDVLIQSSERQKTDRLITPFCEYLSKQTEEIQDKFKILFISVRNFIAVNATKSPTDMPHIAQEKIQNWIKLKNFLDESKYELYEKKVFFLWECYPFWKLLNNSELATQWILKDQEIQKEEYNKLFRKWKLGSSSVNSSREKNKLATVVKKFLDSLPYKDELESLWPEWKESILKCPLQTTLTDLPQEALTAREVVLNRVPLVFDACIQYRDILFAQTAFEEGKLVLKDYTDQEIQEFLHHKSHCPKCSQAAESLSTIMKYRYGQLQRTQPHEIYPKHTPIKEEKDILNARQLVSYYKKRYERIPCELHKYYLALAYKQSGEVEKGRNLLNKSSLENPAVSHMGTVISVHCACGKEDTYHLNALRAPKIALGRLDAEDPLDIPQISVCQPDGLAMSRDMLRFEYQEDQWDWLVHPKAEQAGNLWFSSQDKLFNLLDKQIRADGTTTINYAEYFEPLTRDMWLSDIAGIGVFAESSVLFKGQLLQGIKHPLLERVPFGWYIEVKAQRRSKTIMKSFAEKSFVE